MFAWWRKRKEKAEADHYKRGYDWAAGALLRKEVTPAYIENHTLHSLDDYDSVRLFDKGALDATDKLCECGAVEDNRELLCLTR